MDTVQVKITGQAITSRYGTLNTGDILRTDAAFAKHLVEDCGAAEYLPKAEVSPDSQANAASDEAKKRVKKG